MSIPLIDLTQALTPGGARSTEVVQQLRAAAMDSGFFYISGHDVPSTMVQQQFAVARALFDLPEARKQALSIKHSAVMHGFESLGEQTLDSAARPDLKESFYCSRNHDPSHPYVKAGYHSYGPNQWPEELPWVSSASETYIEHMIGLCRRLMQLMALSLDLPETTFDAMNANPMVTLRMLRYPPHPEGADERTFGAGAHTDWGAVTILAQDHHGGLEVEMPDGRWIAAPSVPNTFVVNLGDMVPRWTNGRYRSNAHRVRNQSSGGQPRYSIPFFFEPDYMARIEALPGTVAPGEPLLFAPCTAGDHLKEMYRRTYGLAA